MSFISGDTGEGREMKFFILRGVLNWSKWCGYTLNKKLEFLYNTLALSVSKWSHWTSSKFSFDSATRKVHTIQMHRTAESKAAADSGICFSIVTKLLSFGVYYLGFMKCLVI